MTGFGYFCSDSENDCSDLMCRFGNSTNEYIYVNATLVSANHLRCKVPQYTKPDVLIVEVTVNGESYTNNNHTFGYFDPFVIDAYPKLLAVDGSTIVEVKGLGFVDSGQCKVGFDNRTSTLTCSGACSKDAKFINKTCLRSGTFPQSEVHYYSSGSSVMWDPFFIDALVWGDQFTENQVTVQYYDEPTLIRANIDESPANIQSQLLLTINFKNNDMSAIVRSGDSKCLFCRGERPKDPHAKLPSNCAL